MNHLEQVLLMVVPVDMRGSIERLSGLVQQGLGRSPCDGTAYGFTNRSHTRLKLLIWDGTGVRLCQRRLHRGHFSLPSAQDAVFRMTAVRLRYL